MDGCRSVAKCGRSATFIERQQITNKDHAIRESGAPGSSLVIAGMSFDKLKNFADMPVWS
jgi:hypothetical protein